jgi:serine/threonine protein phosphatase 1
MGSCLRDEIGSVVLQGNHEAMRLDGGDRLAQVELWLHNGGTDTIESYGLAIGGKALRRFLRKFYLEALPTEHRTWMAALPHRVGALLFVHAGIHPNRPLDWQHPSNLR